MAHNAGLRILLEGLDHNTELIFLPPIVTIEKGDDFAAGLRNAEIKGARLAAVFFPEIIRRGAKRFTIAGVESVRSRC